MMNFYQLYHLGMEPDDIILSKINQGQKDKHVVFSLICGCFSIQIHRVKQHTSKTIAGQGGAEAGWLDRVPKYN